MRLGEGGEFEGKAMDPGQIGPPRAGRKHCKDFNLGLSCRHDVGASEKVVNMMWLETLS